nr:hypothetical protein [Tanacetum cinerariifolium]
IPLFTHHHLRHYHLRTHHHHHYSPHNPPPPPPPLLTTEPTTTIATHHRTHHHHHYSSTCRVNIRAVPSLQLSPQPSPQPCPQPTEADVARSHAGDGEGKGKRKPNLGGRAAGRLNSRDKTRNLSLKEITNTKGPVPIQFELRDKQTVMPLGDHAAHWSSYIGEVIRGVPFYYPSWLKDTKERKAALITDIGTQFDLRPHMESSDWTEINPGIRQHLQKAYNTNKAVFKAQHLVIDPTTETYNVEKFRRERPEMQTSTTQEYPSLIDTFFMANPVNGEFHRDEDRPEVAGVGKRRRVPTFRTARIRMAMAILSCVTYGIFNYYILDAAYGSLLDTAYRSLFNMVSCRAQADIRRIFLDGYGV